MGDIKSFWIVGRILFSSKDATSGRYDERDLLIGHGLDNRCSIRVVFVLSIAVLVGLLINFVCQPDFIGALSFVWVFCFLAWYLKDLPVCGITDALYKTQRDQPQAYRSYLGGRILFTPDGLSLSLRRRKLKFVHRH